MFDWGPHQLGPRKATFPGKGGLVQTPVSPRSRKIFERFKVLATSVELRPSCPATHAAVQAAVPAPHSVKDGRY